MTPRGLLSIIFLFAFSSGLLAAVGVSVEDDFFSPANLTIAAGTTVQWTNNGSNQHTVTSGTGSPDGTFDSGLLNTGKTFSFTFNSVGTYPYYCQVHGTSMSGTITVNCPSKSQLLKNRGFESGNTRWTTSPTNSVINNTSAFSPRSGSWKAQLNGKGTSNTQYLYQGVTISSLACTATLTFYLRVSSTETTNQANDTLKVQILSSGGAVLKTLATFSNLNKGTSYVRKSFNLINFKGSTIRVKFTGAENSSLKTTFLIDDTGLTITE